MSEHLTGYRPVWFHVILGCVALTFAVVIVLYGLATDADMTDIGAKATLATIFGIVMIVRDYRRWQHSIGAPTPGGRHVLTMARKIGWWGAGMILASFVFFASSFIWADARDSHPLMIWVAMFLIGCIMAFVPFLVWWAGVSGLIRLD